MARHLLSLARQLSPAGQRLILAATAKALGWTPEPDQEIVLAAVREADNDLGQEVSQAVYGRWRRQQVAAGRVDLPTANQAARSFDNSWQLLRAYERGEPMPKADVYAGLLLTPVGGSGPEELTLEAIRAWWRASEGASVNYGDFLDWIRNELRGALASGQRRQVQFSREAISRLFGSWKGAIEGAGLLPELTPGQLLSLASTGAQYADEELLVKFRQVVLSAREQGTPTADITAAVYRTERRRMQAAAADQGICLDLPSCVIISQRLGGFGGALVKAGFWTPAQVAGRLRRQGNRFSVSEVKALLLRGALEVAQNHDQPPGALSWSQFLAWREKLFAEEGVLGPHPVTVNARLKCSPWPETVAAVLADREAGSLAPFERDGSSARSAPRRASVPSGLTTPTIPIAADRRAASDSEPEPRGVLSDGQ